MHDLQALGELGKGLTRQQQYIKSLEKSNKDLLELSLIHIELIATLEAELSKSQRVTAIDNSFNGPDKEKV